MSDSLRERVGLGPVTQKAADLRAADPDRGAFVQPFRERIFALESFLKTLPGVLGRDGLPLAHHFASGVYVRELFMPADTHAVGEIHRHDCVNVVIGDVDVFTDAAPDCRLELRGVNVFPSPAGAKRAVHTLGPVLWITVHANPSDERNPETIRQALTAESFAELKDEAQRKSNILPNAE